MQAKKKDFSLVSTSAVSGDVSGVKSRSNKAPFMVGTDEGSVGNMSNKSHLKRYNLVIPQDLFNEVQEIADTNDTTVVEVIKKFIKLGLIASKLQDDPDAALIIREGKKEREVMLL